MYWLRMEDIRLEVRDLGCFVNSVRTVEWVRRRPSCRVCCDVGWYDSGTVGVYWGGSSTRLVSGTHAMMTCRQDME